MSAAALALLVLAMAGCALFGAVPRLLGHGDDLAVAGDLEGALRAYDDALAKGAIGSAAGHARAGRALVTAAIKARTERARAEAELTRVETELSRLREDVSSREREVQRLTRELSVRDGELSRARQDLTARLAELARVSAEAEQLRLDLQDLKRLDIRMERRRP